MQAVTLKLSGQPLPAKCGIAQNFWTRFRGLMLRASLAENEALLFPKCNSIHTFFMRFAIDAVFLDEEGNVVDVLEALPPWRMPLPRWKAKHTLEIAARRAKAWGIQVGSRLSWEGGAS